MSEFDLTIAHVPGKANIIADALSCHADVDLARVAAVSASIESDLLAATRLAQEYDSSNTFSDLKCRVIASDRGMCMHDGLVCHTSRTGAWIIVILDDTAQKQRILALHHDTRLGGHLGPYRMISSSSSRSYWPRMATDARNYCKQCQTCQACKVVICAPQGQLQPLLIPEYSWQYVTIDLITCLPKTDCGIDAIATFIDCLSKYTYFVPVSTLISADELSQVFVATVVARHGVPERPISDRDPQFVFVFQKGLMSALGAQVDLSTAYYPQCSNCLSQTDRQLERQHRSLGQIFCCFASPRQYYWDLLLPCSEFNPNSLNSASTGFSLAYTLYGREPNLRLEAAAHNVTDTRVASVSKSVACMSNVVQPMHKTLSQTADSIARQASRKHSGIEVCVGDQAWLSIEHLRQPATQSHKFAPRFIGPFRVQEAVTPVLLHLDLPIGWRFHPIFHVSQLKSAVGVFIDLPSNQVYLLLLDESSEFEVEGILDLRVSCSSLCKFRVLWKGCSLFESAWELEL